MKRSNQGSKFISFQFLFLLLVVLNAIPVLIFRYYPSLDGPAHVYNANLLREIIFNNNENLRAFFRLNGDLVPNWTSHFLLVLFRLVFSSAVADKLFLLILAFSLPLTVFVLIRHLAPQNRWLSVFSLPFVYTFTFGLGFYNFSIGVVVFLYTLYFWIKRDNRSPILNLAGLMGLFTLSYFSHLLPFILTVSSVGLFSLLELFRNIHQKTSYQDSLKDIMLIVVAAIPGLVLSYLYLSTWNPPDNSTRLTVVELLKWIIDTRSLIIHNYEREVAFSRCIFFVAVSLLMYTAFRYFYKMPNRQAFNQFNLPRLYFGLLSAIFLLLYLFFPDNSSGGGLISVRLNIFFYLVLFIWLSTFNYHKNLLRISFILILIATVALSFRNYIGLRSYTPLVRNFREAEKLVTENSIILPVPRNVTLMDDHFAHFLGWNKPVIILENFEASTTYFPLVWNRDEMPAVRLGDSVVSDVCLHHHFPASAKDEVCIDFIVSWGEKEFDDCQESIKSIMERDYRCVYSDKQTSFALYQFNRPEGHH